MSKTTFRILPDQTYVVTIDGEKIEVLGKEILSILKKDFKSKSWSIFNKC